MVEVIKDSSANKLHKTSTVQNYIVGGMSSMDAPIMMMAGITSVNGNSAAMQEQSGAINLANTKEKTPMCLVNELARYNKVKN